MHQVEAGEEIMRFARRAETAADIEHHSVVRLERDLERTVIRAEDESNFVAGFGVSLDRRSERKGAEDIAVVDPEGTITKQVLDVFDAARGLENFRPFVSELDGQAIVDGLWKGFCVGFGRAVRAHR